MKPHVQSARIRQICRIAPVIPVLVVTDAGCAARLASALVAGGLPVLEITLRTPAALDAIRAMTDVTGAVVGAGTLLTPQDVAAAKQAGAAFGVSPGASAPLLQAATDLELPLLPGAATASEVMELLERGFDAVKFFPAEAAGGVSALKALGGPLPQVAFCPTGGVGPDNAAAYLALPNVLCVGGSWVAPGAEVGSGNWAAIEALARAGAGLPRASVSAG